MNRQPEPLLWKNLFLLFCLSKKVNKKGHPGVCFSPPSENIENLIKVFLTLKVRKTPMAPLQIF